MRHLLSIIFVFGLGITTPCFSQTQKQEPLYPDGIIDSEALKSPFITKYMYREAWYLDNFSDISLLTRLESIKNNPSLDKTIKKYMELTYPTMKRLSFQLKGKSLDELAQHLPAIEKDPVHSFADLSTKMTTEIKEDEIKKLFEMEDEVKKKTIELGKTNPGETAYPINLKDF